MAAIGVSAVAYLSYRYGKAVTWDSLLSPNARSANGSDRDRLDGPLNYLLIGSDLRVNNPGAGQRSDTIIIVHIPASLDRAYLVSIPRDLRVNLPPMPQFGLRGGIDKINAAFAYGGSRAAGVQVLSETLSRLIGIDFDGAAVVEFSGFKNALGVLGGVTMCVDTKTKSIHTGAVFLPGCQRMNPSQALDYVRQRYDQPDGDYGRQRHQQQLLKAVFTEAMAQGIVDNPVKLDRLVRAVGSAVTLDLNGVPLPTLVVTLRDIKPDGLIGVRVPSHPANIGGTSFVVSDDGATSLYQALRSDSMGEWVAADPAWVNQL